MKRFYLPILLASLLGLSVSADDFEDFIQVCAKVSANYNHGVVARGTRLDKEYQMDLELMHKLAVSNQQVIRKLQLGHDFDFPWFALELKKIYLLGQQRFENGGSSSRTFGQYKPKNHRSGNNNRKNTPKELLPYSETPNGLIKVLTEDIKALRKMEFTTEDGGSIKSSLETSRKILEFKRLVAFFRKNYRTVLRIRQVSGRYLKDSGSLKNDSKDISLDRLFRARLRHMSQLALVLMETAREKYPDTLSRYNLNDEVLRLEKNFELWDDFNMRAARRRNTSRPGKSTSSRPRMDALNNPSAFLAEINVSLRNIHELLNLWEQAGFRSDPPVQRGSRITNSDDAAAPLLQQSKKTDYSAMDQKQLHTLLQQRRQEIFRSNRSMDGFDRDAERRFLMTLSREQKRQYNDSVRNFQQQGYSAGQAVRNSILKIDTMIRMENKPLPAREAIRILQALDRDQTRRQENNKDIDFKQERVSSE